MLVLLLVVVCLLNQCVNVTSQHHRQHIDWKFHPDVRNKLKLKQHMERNKMAEGELYSAHMAPYTEEDDGIDMPALPQSRLLFYPLKNTIQLLENMKRFAFRNETRWSKDELDFCIRNKTFSSCTCFLNFIKSFCSVVL